MLPYHKMLEMEMRHIQPPSQGELCCDKRWSSFRRIMNKYGGKSHWCSCHESATAVLIRGSQPESDGLRKTLHVKEGEGGA